MKQSTFVKLGITAFGLILVAFIIRGTSRLIIGDRIATGLSAPFGITAGLILVVLFATAILDKTGIKRMQRDIED